MTTSCHHFCLSHQYEHPTLEDTNPQPTSDVKREAWKEIQKEKDQEQRTSLAVLDLKWEEDESITDHARRSSLPRRRPQPSHSAIILCWTLYRHSFLPCLNTTTPVIASLGWHAVYTSHNLTATVSPCACAHLHKNSSLVRFPRTIKLWRSPWPCLSSIPEFLSRTLSPARVLTSATHNVSKLSLLKHISHLSMPTTFRFWLWNPNPSGVCLLSTRGCTIALLVIDGNDSSTA